MRILFAVGAGAAVALGCSAGPGRTTAAPQRAYAQQCEAAGAELPDTLRVVRDSVSQPVRSTLQQTHAGSRGWFHKHRPIRFREQTYLKYGNLFAVSDAVQGPQSGEVVRIGEYDGVPVYALADYDPARSPFPGAVYLPVNACQLQMYREASEVRSGGRAR